MYLIFNFEFIKILARKNYLSLKIYFTIPKGIMINIRKRSKINILFLAILFCLFQKIYGFFVFFSRKVNPINLSGMSFFLYFFLEKVLFFLFFPRTSFPPLK